MTITLNRTTIILLAILLGGGLVIGIIAFRSAAPVPTAKAAIVRYMRTDTDRPKASLETTQQDLGIMRVTEERAATFIVKNNGNKPLQLFHPRTSCMCTFITVTMNGETSPEWNMEMHNPASARAWIGTVTPGATATITGIYRPSVMPVQGPVERKILLDTNDPEQPTLDLTLRAIVQ